MGLTLVQKERQCEWQLRGEGVPSQTCFNRSVILMITRKQSLKAIHKLRESENAVGSSRERVEAGSGLARSLLMFIVDLTCQHRRQRC